MKTFIGETFGSLTVIRSIVDLNGEQKFVCDCICGNQVAVKKSYLHRRANNPKRPRCSECSYRAKIKHGETAGHKPTPEHRTWSEMKQKCYSPTHHAYADYGGRGITMCDRWRYSFLNFLEDMGRKPSAKHSIDRINNDGNYEPSNCRWATALIQANNTRRTRKIRLYGANLSTQEWCRLLGMGRTTLRHRLNRGMPEREALLTPIRIYPRRPSAKPRPKPDPAR